jgi:hypothetical protein
MRSIHFPSARVESPRPDSTPAPRVNALESFSSALRDAETIREKLRGLVVSDGRHGDLQTALSAARELEGHLLELIEAEEV